MPGVLFAMYTIDTIKVYGVPSPKDNSAKGEVPMPSYEEVTQRAGSVRALTGLTEAEFQALLPHFEQALATYRHDRTIDGHPRTSRRYSTYDTCPLPTLADKRLFILTYLKQHPIQEVQGQLFGMSQSNANTWIHVLHPVLHQALADHELLPARTAAEFAAMFETHAPDGRATTPLFGMMAPNVRSTARPIPKSTKHITVARRRVTRSPTSS
jgi:Helix-turn-helix of DDE superfamily endonuclease